MTWTIFAVASVVLLGLSAGVFFGFSSFIMSGLARASDDAAGAGMNGINESAVRPRSWPSSSARCSCRA
nr:hypothetical protein GCM10025730_14580 [Promicromonospora thailandica]